jgi:aldehyde dehydrogenase (NAD+)/aldehyde dehydrogenase
MELIGDILPAGVLNIVTGFGAEAGQALATSKRIAKLSFTGSTTGRKVYHNAAENIIPVTMELGGNLQIFSSICSSSR